MTNCQRPTARRSLTVSLVVCGTIGCHLDSTWLTATRAIVVVDIDDRAIARFGPTWPILRAHHAAIIRAISGADARGTLYDVRFVDVALFSKDDDDTLCEALAESQNVVLPGMASQSSVLGRAIPTVHFGDEGFVRDRTGALHLISTFGKQAGNPTCEALMACLATGRDVQGIPRLHVRLRQPPQPFQRLSVLDLLNMTPKERRGLLNGKLVVVGVTATSQATGIPTRWSSATPRNDARGAAIAAMIVRLDELGP